MQLPRQVAAALLMPHPVRGDAALGSGAPILKADRYAIEHIEIRGVELIGDSRSRLAVGYLTLRNYNLHAEMFSAEERIAQIRTLWERADELPEELANLVSRHRDMVGAGGPLTRDAEVVVEALQTRVTESAQDLGILYRSQGEDVVPDLLAAVQLSEEPPAPPVSVEEVAPEETEIRRRTVREWKRWANSRGAASARFRRRVREAYTWTCVVCGVYLPATRFNRVPGVDAAHILPWAEYDLDEIANGLCLCRQHHWAFDEALLVVRWESPWYVVEVPQAVADLVLSDDPYFDLDSLTQYVGRIPEERLPRESRNRPNPAYLERLYESET